MLSIIIIASVYILFCAFCYENKKVVIKPKYRTQDGILEYSVDGKYWSQISKFENREIPSFLYIKDPIEIDEYIKTHTKVEDIWEDQSNAIEEYKQAIEEYLNEQA